MKTLDRKINSYAVFDTAFLKVLGTVQAIDAEEALLKAKKVFKDSHPVIGKNIPGAQQDVQARIASREQNDFNERPIRTGYRSNFLRY